MRGVVDLALPADVAPEVVRARHCLVNLDRLVTEQPDAASAQEIEDAALVREEVADFLGLRRAAQVAPTVVALRSWPRRWWRANCAVGRPAAPS